MDCKRFLQIVYNPLSYSRKQFHSETKIPDTKNKTHPNALIHKTEKWFKSNIVSEKFVPLRPENQSHIYEKNIVDSSRADNLRIARNGKRPDRSHGRCHSQRRRYLRRRRNATYRSGRNVIHRGGASVLLKTEAIRLQSLQGLSFLSTHSAIRQSSTLYRPVQRQSHMTSPLNRTPSFLKRLS